MRPIVLLRVVAALAILGLVGILGWSLRSIRRPPPQPRPAFPSGPSVSSAVSGFEFVKTEAGQDRFRVVAGRLLTFEGKTHTLEGVEITLFRPGGRDVVIRGDRAIVETAASRAELAGNVSAEEPGGVRLEAPSGRWDGERGVLEAGAVAFSRPGARGRGDRLAHHLQNGDTSLEGNVLMTLEPESPGGPEATLTASRLDWSGKTGLLLARESGAERVRLGWDGSRFEAVELRALLDPSTGVLRSIEGTGNAWIHMEHDGIRAVRSSAPGGAERLLLRGGRTGEARDLRGESIFLAFDGSGALEDVRAVGSARAETGGSSRARMSAEAIRILLGEGGRPGSIEGTGAASVTLGLGADAKLLEGGSVSIGMDADGDPRKIVAEGVPGGSARFTENAAGGRTARIAVARRIEAELGEEGEGVRSALLRDGVRVQEGETTAGGREGTFDGNRMALTGDPWIESPQGKVFGDRILWIRAGEGESRSREGKRDREGSFLPSTASGTLRVEGNVRSVQRPGEKDSLLPGGREASTAPLYVTAEDSMESAAPGEIFAYRGRVVLKQGDSTLSAEEVDADGKAGRLAARGSVRTRVRLSAKRGTEAPEGTSRNVLLDPERLVEGRGDRLDYDRKGGRIVYEGEASLSQDTSRLQGRRIEIRLGAAGDTVEHVTCTGGCEATTSTRIARGEEIDWDAPAALLMIAGGRSAAVAIDREKGVETRGESLTWSTRDDTLTAVSGPHGRSVTTYGAGSRPESSDPGSGR